MKRRIKFRAYIPKLDIMLDKISLLCDGNIEVYEDHFNEKLLEKDKDLFIDWDYDNEGNDSIMKYRENNESIKILPFKTMYTSHLQIHHTNCVINLNTGMEDSKDKDIYEGDIVEITRPAKYYDPDEESSEIITRKEVVSIKDRQLTYDWNGNKGKPIFTEDYLFMRNITSYTSSIIVIGNIYQHKNLLFNPKSN